MKPQHLEFKKSDEACARLFWHHATLVRTFNMLIPKHLTQTSCYYYIIFYRKAFAMFFKNLKNQILAMN